MRSGAVFYGILILTFIYSIYKFRGSIFHILIILLFYDGLFAYEGARVWNLYKSFLPVLAFYCFLRYRSSSKISGYERPVIFTFLLFTASFLLSSYINGDYFTLTFSQYAKYVDLFLCFFILRKISLTPYSFDKIRRLIFLLLLIQIGLTVIKFYVWGIRESVVGSISFAGGGVAAVLPILGFVFIWQIRRGNLANRDWLIVAMFMFIGFVSMKRAIWFIMPVVVFLFYTYVPGKKLSKKLLFVIPVVPLIFYLGVRYNPSLNPEHAIGGSFDLNYAFNFAKEYSFGKNENDVGTGRGGATILLFTKLISLDYSESDLIGNGLKPIYAAEEETYNDPAFGINQRGSATGIYQTYISAGFLGVIATLAFALSLLYQIKDKRFRNGIIIIFLWDYLFYSGLILRTQALSFLLIFFIIYSNMQLKYGKYLSNGSSINKSAETPVEAIKTY